MVEMHFHIKVKIPNTRFVASGFLPEKIVSVRGYVMLELAACRNGPPISTDADMQALKNFLLQEEKPSQFRHWRLATGKVDPKHPKRLHFLQYDGDGWFDSWVGRNDLVDDKYLVVCSESAITGC